MGRTTWTLPDFDAYFSLTASEALERFITQKRVDIARIRKSLIEPEALEAEAITMLAQMPAV